MAESTTVVPAEKPTGSQIVLKVILAILVLLLIGAFYMIVDLRGRVRLLEANADRQSAETKVIEDKLHLTSKNIEASMQELGSRVGSTQEDIARRTAELKAQQESSSAKLSASQQEANRQLASVNTQVSGVRTELGGTRSDLASTRSDLAATKAKLETAIGDLNIHSGLIARNHDELEILKHKGDRNYFEFSLHKKQRQVISTIALELRKADPKKSRFTLNVYADDHTIEKKDRTLGEPLQFYTGRERHLYEIVIFTVDKDHIAGYLSTPK